MSRITLCYQAEWGLEIKAEFSYTKDKLFFGINDRMTCENLSAAHAFSVSLSKVIQLRILAPPFINGV